ncbi:MAG TPA: polysaccharide pyruvyl transferase family protein [Trueperaceae bacterium]|nr:polysaccharide pyruvyl transferase family protein [Trueperaceae bacterium]
MVTTLRTSEVAPDGAPAPLRVCFVNDTSRNPNWGCRATTGALKDALAARGAEVVSTIYLEDILSFAPRDSRRWRRAAERFDRLLPRRPFVREVARRAFKRVARRVPDVVPLDARGLDDAALAMAHGEALEFAAERLAAADAVFINGEGAVYDLQRKGRALMLMALFAKRHLGKWVGILNHTADLTHPGMRAFAEAVYPQLDDVTFREARSLESCAPFVNGRLVPDAAFALAPAERGAWASLAARPGHYDVFPDRARFDPTRPYVVVGGSAQFAWARKRDPHMPDAHPTGDPSPGFRSLVEALRARGHQVVLTASDKPDEDAFRPLAAELDVPLVATAAPVLQAVDLIGNAAAYVGGRWHPAIFGLRGGTPFVPLTSNSFKLTALAEMVGLPSPALDSMDLAGSVERAVDLVERHLDEGEELRSRLRGLAARMAVESTGHVAMLPTSAPA